MTHREHIEAARVKLRELDEKRRAKTAVIEEAWRLCWERCDLGPEPSWWRFIARARWRARYHRPLGMRVTEADIAAAARNLGAAPALVDEMLAAHRLAYFWETR